MAPATSSKAQQLKKQLIAAGFEIYRTLGDEIALADRVRDNLIMDSGVRVGTGSPTRVRLVLALRRSEHRTDTEAAIFDKVRAVASELVDAGFAEVGTSVSEVKDPADDSLVLDTFFEVIFATDVADLEGSADLIRTAISVGRRAPSRH